MSTIPTPPAPSSLTAREPFERSVLAVDRPSGDREVVRQQSLPSAEVLGTAGLRAAHTQREIPEGRQRVARAQAERQTFARSSPWRRVELAPDSRRQQSLSCCRGRTRKTKGEEDETGEPAAGALSPHAHTGRRSRSQTKTPGLAARNAGALRSALDGERPAARGRDLARCCPCCSLRSARACPSAVGTAAASPQAQIVAGCFVFWTVLFKFYHRLG